MKLSHLLNLPSSDSGKASCLCQRLPNKKGARPRKRTNCISAVFRVNPKNIRSSSSKNIEAKRRDRWKQKARHSGECPIV
jgi:hypothetical protein